MEMYQAFVTRQGRGARRFTVCKYLPGKLSNVPSHAYTVVNYSYKTGYIGFEQQKNVAVINMRVGRRRGKEKFNYKSYKWNFGLL